MEFSQKPVSFQPTCLRRRYWFCLLVVINLAVFSSVQDFEFLDYDDSTYVSQNPYIQDGLTADGICWAFSAGLIFKTFNIDYWQPVTVLSRMLDVTLFGFDPGMHHLMNLAFHILNTLLLFQVLSLMTGRMERSFWVAALFAIHPLHVESVAWITARKDVLFVFFWLLATLVYLRFVKSPRWTTYFGVLMLFACSMMSKMTAVTFPFALLLLDYWPLRRAELTRQDLRKWGWLVLEKVPFLIIGVLAGYGSSRFLTTHLQLHSYYVVLTNALFFYARYLVKMVYPFGLAIHYPYPGIHLTLTQIVGASLLLILISVWAIYKTRKAPYLLVGWCWFLGILAPTLRLNDIAGDDRFTYLPYIGIFVVLVWGTAEWLKGRTYLHLAARISALLGLLVLMTLSWIQTSKWHNTETVMDHLLKVNPHDWLGHYQMGVILSEREPERSKTHFRESLKLKSNFGRAHHALGIAFLREGRIQESIQYFKESLKYDPDHPVTACNLGDAYLLLKDLPQAQNYYFHTLQLNPNYVPAHHHLALCLAGSGHYLFAEKHLMMALQYRSSSELDRRQMMEDLKTIRSKMDLL